MGEKHGGPNGFLLGLIIGGSLGVLLSTKRGRQLIKDIADYGLDYVGKTISMEDIESILDEDEEEMYADELDMTKPEKERVKEERVSAKDTVTPAPKAHEEAHSRRRLFRGIRKK